MAGVMREYAGPRELIEAAREARAAGCQQVDAFSPFPLEELEAILPVRPERISRVVFWGALIGSVLAFSVMTLSAVWHYPFRVGGTPAFAWPAFLAITFETGVLFGSLGAFFGCLLFCGLPRLHHPLFEHEGFSAEKFYLWIGDPRVLCLLAVFLTGCALEKQQVHYQEPRVPPAGAVPIDPDPAPPRLTRALVLRGQERFRIYCAPCHGFMGRGDGVVVQRGFKQPPSFLTKRLREVPDQHLWSVITNGSGVMYPYADRVAPADRWAIVHYIRVLQEAQP